MYVIVLMLCGAMSVWGFVSTQLGVRGKTGESLPTHTTTLVRGKSTHKTSFPRLLWRLMCWRGVLICVDMVTKDLCKVFGYVWMNINESVLCVCQLSLAICHILAYHNASRPRRQINAFLMAFRCVCQL